MTREEAFEQAKQDIIGNDIIITSLDETEALYGKFIKLRTELSIVGLQLIDVMPHYRGEQMYGWDIRPGIFRPPIAITDPTIGKNLEKQAIEEFEKVIKDKVGEQVFRNIFYKEKHGKDWDLLFQAQHAGIKTTLTDWSPDIISALYFATELSNDSTIEKSDGQLWCFIVPTNDILSDSTYPNRNTFYDLDPFEMTRTVMINASSYLDNIQDRIFEYRMFRQKGRFVMPSKSSCHIPLNQQGDFQKFLFRAKIPAQFKQSIRGELAQRNVLRASMYIEENPQRQDWITEINNYVFTGH